jgi:FkbM family methyltransferase
MPDPTFPATKRTVTRNGRRYSVWDEHPHVGGWDFWTLFATGAWEPHLDTILAEHLTPQTTMVDVGAWIGPVSLIASRLCRKVIAVEPDPVAGERLLANLARQRKQNVTVHAAALGAVDGTVRIGRRADRRFGDSMTSTIFIEDAVEVRAVTLEHLLDEEETETVGLVKMDIEGGEEQVLPACVGMIRQLGAPLLLSIHTALVVDAHRYLGAVQGALDGFETTLLSGRWEGLGTVLAVPS